MSETFEYKIVESPTAPSETPEIASSSTPVRMTPEMLETLAERSKHIKRIRQLVEDISQTPAQRERREKRKARARVKNAMARASRKRNRRS